MNAHPPAPDGSNPIYVSALEEARAMMDALPELEPISALKQAASSRGIEWGEPMAAFVEWANAQLFPVEDNDQGGPRP